MSAAVAVVGAAALYALGLAGASRRAWGAAAAWGAGLGVLGLAASPWMEGGADRSLSMHMIQHALLGLVAAPLLVAGAPVRLALSATRGATRRRLAALLRAPLVRALATPAVGCIAYISVLGAVHLPAVYDLGLRSGAAHAAIHAALLWSALLLWLPLIAADPLPHRASPLATVGALIAAMAAMAALGAVLAGEPRVLYAPYARHAGALADQHLAGGLMSVGGMVVMLPAFVLLAWRALAAEERRAVARERHAAGGAR